MKKQRIHLVITSRNPTTDKALLQKVHRDEQDSDEETEELPLEDDEVKDDNEL